MTLDFTEINEVPGELLDYDYDYEDPLNEEDFSLTDYLHSDTDY